VFAELGFRCVAPDLRGYGRSSIYDRQQDYSVEYGVRDMIELQDALGQAKAIWVGVRMPAVNKAKGLG
jgi:pimeloyl-ACP methyl ester carboxylesterase